ncbi:MAG TPA: PTS sugar transporter subunit IIA [Rectinema sp.]|jgi:PTS system nitrogen regulatory IIA component|nr:PTS sugar transporter subunit IIA [Spirochaetia bacterium]MDI9427265.1 PTS sugar transporter subunit IIA [Spirochaetota bacterium]NLH90466.1 PTS sugar transporter subunit IIA [Treponema sp.]OQC75076.1 MAG: PTS system fructose-specific EIIABC component [Spirochaetes bacterium ADurb.Bin001]HNP92727.1 PTS sugar transporter subunit IIA [Rectinema sp.]
MDLKEILKPELISLDLKGRNKEEIIRELVDLASNSGKVLDKEETIQSVLEREYRMSTGMKHGIAIPHGKTTAVHELVACVGITKEEVDFDALDRKGCRIFIMTLSPIDKTGPHLQFLAEVGMLFRSEEKRQALLEARTKEEVVSILLGNA